MVNGDRSVVIRRGRISNMKKGFKESLDFLTKESKMSLKK